MGREIADVWIPDEVLHRQVRRSIGPQIELHKSDEDRSYDSWFGVLGLAVVLTVVALVGVLLWVVPIELPPQLWFLADMIVWLRTLPVLLVVGVAAILVLVTVLAAMGTARAKRDAASAYDATVKSHYAAAFQGASAVLESRRRKVGMVVEPSPHRAYPTPSPRPGGVDARGAEEVVAQWMRHLGEVDAELTSYTGDGGIDVQGVRSFAQVKHYAKAVGIAPIRELGGVAAHDPQRRQPLFFTSTGYARGAVDFADDAGIALFVYSAEQGGLEAMNGRAKTLMHNGI